MDILLDQRATTRQGRCWYVQPICKSVVCDGPLTNTVGSEQVHRLAPSPFSDSSVTAEVMIWQ